MMTPQQETLVAAIEEAVFQVITAHQQPLPAAPTQELINSPAANMGPPPLDGTNGKVSGRIAYQVVMRLLAAKEIKSPLSWDRCVGVEISIDSLHALVKEHLGQRGLSLNTVPTNDYVAAIRSNLKGRWRSFEDRLSTRMMKGMLLIPYKKISLPSVPERLR